MKLSDIKKSININEFFERIEHCKTMHDCSYLEAIMHCCEEYNIELDVAATIIRSNPTMKKKLKECSTKLRLLLADEDEA